MRVLVTGAYGFVGRHLGVELEQRGHTPLPLLHPSEGPAPPQGAVADICDREALAAAVEALQPEAVIHLAGMAFVPAGWTEPGRMFTVNTVGTLHLLEALRATAPTAPCLVVSSAEVYGRAARPRPLVETDAFQPSNMYAVSKAAADQAALLYAQRYGMPVMSARPGNHIGPGQSPDFVAPAFARQVAAIRRGEQDPVMRVGNLDNHRDFLDVRDVARGYVDLLEKGHPGEAYNLAMGQGVLVRSLLETLCRLAGVQPEITVDPARYRATDDPPLIDISKIREHAGWQPAIPLEQTLADILEQDT